MTPRSRNKKLKRSSNRFSQPMIFCLSPRRDSSMTWGVWTIMVMLITLVSLDSSLTCRICLAQWEEEVVEICQLLSFRAMVVSLEILMIFLRLLAREVWDLNLVDKILGDRKEAVLMITLLDMVKINKFKIVRWLIVLILFNIFISSKIWI